MRQAAVAGEQCPRNLQRYQPKPVETRDPARTGAAVEGEFTRPQDRVTPVLRHDDRATDGQVDEEVILWRPADQRRRPEHRVRIGVDRGDLHVGDALSSDHDHLAPVRQL
jgi:hypothetical protein